MNNTRRTFTAEALCPNRCFSPEGPTAKMSMLCRQVTMVRSLMNYETLFENINETNEDDYYNNVHIAEKVGNDLYTALDWKPKKRYIAERRAACEKPISPLVTRRKSPHGKTTEQPNMTRQWTKSGTKFFFRWITDENTIKPAKSCESKEGAHHVLVM